MDKEEISTVLPPEETLKTLAETYIRDIFRAYGLSTSGLNHEEQLIVLIELSKLRRTFNFLKEVIESDRYPRTVMLLASKVGMYIPPFRRIGLRAYEFYLANIKYYETVLERPSMELRIPSLNEIFMAKDRISFLMRCRDDEILRPGYKFSRRYDDRREMIKKFITDNILPLGEFRLQNNSRSSYSSKTKTIIYNDTKTTISYSVAELLKLFDLSRRVLWKDSRGFTSPQKDLAFSQLSLLHLRQQILEKFGQWRDHNSYQSSGSKDLYQVLTSLDLILIDEPRYDIGAYLSTPRLE